MQKTITFTFGLERIRLPNEIAIALLGWALHILEVDARLRPNYREFDILNGWTEPEVDDPFINYDAAEPTSKNDMVNQIYWEMYNAAVDDPMGGFWCYDPFQQKGKWNFDPFNIAREMNRSYMFDFTVSPVHVEQAQAMLKGRV